MNTPDEAEEGATNAWRYRLNALQTIANPQAAIAFFIAGFIALAISAATSMARGEIANYAMVFLVGLFVLGIAATIYVTKQIRNSHKELTIKVRSDALCCSQLIPEDGWVPRNNFRRNSKNQVKCWKGLFGCRLIGLTSGHAVVVPDYIFSHASFQNFIRGTNLEKKSGSLI